MGLGDTPCPIADPLIALMTWTLIFGSLAGFVLGASYFSYILWGVYVVGRVYRSMYFSGVPLEMFGLAWSLGILATAVGGQHADELLRARVRRYAYWWAFLGLSGVLWVLVEIIRFGQWSRPPGSYWIAGLLVLAAYTTAAFSTNPARVDLRQLSADFARFTGQIGCWTLTLLALGAIALVPRYDPAGPSGRLAFQTWYRAQPRIVLGNKSGSDRPVSVVIFVDYLCPACRELDKRLGRVLETLNPEDLNRIDKSVFDFPLDRDCNPVLRDLAEVDVHPLACDVAAAVRIARDAGHGPGFERWVWTNQSRISEKALADELRAIGQSAATGSTVLPEVIADAEDGGRLGIRATPALWINGVRLGVLSESQLAWVLRRELGNDASR